MKEFHPFDTMVCLSNAESLLEVRNLNTFNKALLGIWMWKFSIAGNTHWGRVEFAGYFGEWGVFCTEFFMGKKSGKALGVG